jgi:NAD-dependent deacetylase
LPSDVLRESMRLSEHADLFLAMGSSLVVQPAAGLPALAKQHGARLVIINRDPTPLDGMADAVMRRSIGETLSAIQNHLTSDGERGESSKTSRPD